MRMNAESSQTSREPTFSRKALERMYEEYSPGLYRYAYRILGEQDLAEDCVAETFSRLLQEVKRGRGPRDNPQAYLYRIAHNWSMDQHRSRRSVVASLDTKRIGDESHNPAMLAAERATRDRVRAAMMKLPDDQRSVILLRVMELMPHKQVAEILGKTVEATRALQYRGLGNLREMLLESEDVHE